MASHQPNVPALSEMLSKVQTGVGELEAQLAKFQAINEGQGGFQRDLLTLLANMNIGLSNISMCFAAMMNQVASLEERVSRLESNSDAR